MASLKIVIAGCLLLGAGCRLEQSRAGCVAATDCDEGKLCRAGSCIDVTSDAASFPPLSCAQPDGTLHPYDRAGLQRLLPGEWLFCGGMNPGPQDAIGFAINSDATQWWYLVDDGQGHAIPRQGFEEGGPVDWIVAAPGMESNFVQLNLIDEAGGGITIEPVLTDGPPLRMYLFDGSDTSYVHDDSAGAGIDGGASGAVDGGWSAESCNPNALSADSCPPADGVRCSICNTQCVRPCRSTGSDCPTSQTCAPLDGVTLSGDCSGFDGYCM